MQGRKLILKAAKPNAHLNQVMARLRVGMKWRHVRFRSNTRTFLHFRPIEYTSATESLFQVI
jgi:hypothetical protein